MIRGRDAQVVAGLVRELYRHLGMHDREDWRCAYCAIRDSLPAVTNGSGLVVDGDWLVISTHDLINQNVAADQGKVLVYRRTAGQWSFQQLLIPSGTPARFGTSLAIEGDRIVVGDKGVGMVHVFDRAAAGWQESARFSDPSVGILGLSGDRIAVGRPVDSALPAVPGVRIYDRDAAGNWGLVASIAPPAGAHPTTFGVGLALDGDTIMLGDRNLTSPQLTVGAVTIYSLTPSGWAQVGQLFATPDQESPFGQPIDWEGADLVVGSVYTGLTRFRFIGGTWVHEATFDRYTGVSASRGLCIVGDRIFTATHSRGVQVVPWRPLGGIMEGCAGHTNSSGSVVRLDGVTTPSVTGAPFEPFVNFPTGRLGTSGFFLAGPSAAQLPFGGGELCIGGGIVRLGPGGPPNSFFGLTSIFAQVDPALHPGLIQPGATVHFQYWYPDPQGHPRGNLSNSLAVTYCP